MGKTIEHFRVVGYDFLTVGSTDEGEGMLGLDFLKDTRLYIDFADQFMELSSVK